MKYNSKEAMHGVEAQSSHVSVLFVDDHQEFEQPHVLVDKNIGWISFLAVLYELTQSIASRITDLAVVIPRYQGLTLEDGDWWYRIVHRTCSTANDSSTYDEGQVRNITVNIEWGVWTVLNCSTAFAVLMHRLRTGYDLSTVWIEVQHQLQKDRDEAYMQSLNDGHDLTFEREMAVHEHFTYMPITHVQPPPCLELDSKDKPWEHDPDYGCTPWINGFPLIVDGNGKKDGVCAIVMRAKTPVRKSSVSGLAAEWFKKDDWLINKAGVELRVGSMSRQEARLLKNDGVVEMC